MQAGVGGIQNILTHTELGTRLALELIHWNHHYRMYTMLKWIVVDLNTGSESNLESKDCPY